METLSSVLGGDQPSVCGGECSRIGLDTLRPGRKHERDKVRTLQHCPTVQSAKALPSPLTGSLLLSHEGIWAGCCPHLSDI